MDALFSTINIIIPQTQNTVKPSGWNYQNS